MAMGQWEVVNSLFGRRKILHIVLHRLQNHTQIPSVEFCLSLFIGFQNLPRVAKKALKISSQVFTCPGLRHLTVVSLKIFPFYFSLNLKQTQQKTLGSRGAFCHDDTVYKSCMRLKFPRVIRMVRVISICVYSWIFLFVYLF